MKNLYLFFLTVLFSGVPFLPVHAVAGVCQNKTTIVFSNGMFRNADQAFESLEALQTKLEQNSSVFSDTTKYEYKLAFANGKGGPFGSTGFDQLLEVARQAYGDKALAWFWRALIGDGLISNAVFRLAMQDIAASFHQVQYVDDLDAIKMGNDYRTFLNAGKRILIVAHSQGNFYTNAVYNKLTTENPAWASSIGVVAVATPANSSPGGKLGLNEPNITVPEDFVIAAVRNTFGSLPPKSDQWILPGSSNVFQSGLSWLDFEQTTLGHSFVGWYLAGTYTRNLILKGITDQLIGKPGGGFGSGILGTPPKVNFPFSVIKSDRFNTVGSDLNYCSPDGVYYEASIAQGVSIIKASGISVPSATGGAGFVGFVPIPNGIGELYVNTQYDKVIVFDSTASDYMYLGTTNVTLKSNTWDTTSRVWATSTSTMTMPSYTMTVQNGLCLGWDPRPFPTSCNIPPDPTVFIVPIAIAADYSAVVSHTSQLYDSSPFYRLGAYNATAVMASRADDNHFVWKTVTVDNGVLSVMNGGVITPNDIVLVRPYPAVYEVVADIGLSTNQFFLTKVGAPIMGVGVIAYNEEVGSVFAYGFDVSIRVK